MMNSIKTLSLVVFGAAMLGGCASDAGSPFGSSIATGAIGSPSATAMAAPAAPKVDPACAALQARIDGLRNEGVVQRVEKVAAAGKSATVAVKRASLAQVAELDNANAEFQAKCSTLGPRPLQATQHTPAPIVSTAAVATQTATAPPAGTVGTIKKIATTTTATPAPPVVVAPQQ